MLQHLTAEQVKEVARLAREARSARDRVLRDVPEAELGLGQPKPGRGVHTPAAALGFRPLSPQHPARAALERAISALSPEAAAELRALMWIGREEEYGANELGKAFAASMAATESVSASLLDRADLHDLLTKALYELKLG